MLFLEKHAALGINHPLPILTKFLSYASPNIFKQPLNHARLHFQVLLLTSNLNLYDSGFETQICENICPEFTISKKKWICFSVCRPPSYNNIIIFFEELTKSVWMTLNTNDNIMVMDDFNININKYEGIGYDKLDVFCDILNLTNLLKSETCYINNHKSTIDLYLTNKTHSFQFTSVTETGLSNYHRLIETFMKSHFSRLKPKTLKDSTSKYLFPALTNALSLIVEKHASLKKKIVLLQRI